MAAWDDDHIPSHISPRIRTIQLGLSALGVLISVVAGLVLLIGSPQTPFELLDALKLAAYGVVTWVVYKEFVSFRRLP